MKIKKLKRGINSGVVKGDRGLAPLKIMRDFGRGWAPFLRLDKFKTTHFPQKKRKVRFYQKKKNATTLYLLSPSFNTFTDTGLTSTLLSYM